MTEQTAPGSVWDRLDTLSDQELAALVNATITVLEGSAADADDSESVRDMPPGPLSQEIQRLLNERGLSADTAAAQSIVKDQATGRTVAIALLTEIRQVPGLPEQIEAAYQARKQLLIIDGGILLAGALVLLVLKLKKIHVGKDSTDIEFDQVPSSALAILKAILRI